MTIREELQKLWTSGGQAIIEVEFFDQANAARLCRFINRHLGKGHASRRGSHVLVKGIPAEVMKRIYLYLGAAPAHEWRKGE